MASKVAGAAKSRSDELLSFGLTAGFIAGGYWLWRSSRKRDLVEMDAAEARPTRHMVPIEARLDRERLARWLEDEERRAREQAAGGAPQQQHEQQQTPGGAVAALK